MKKFNCIYDVVLREHSTEKTVMLSDKMNCVTFVVSSRSSKSEIKNVVEKLFNVFVNSVRIINVKGKLVKFKNSFGKQKDWKKAIVFLRKDCKINFSEFK